MDCFSISADSPDCFSISADSPDCFSITTEIVETEKNYTASVVFQSAFNGSNVTVNFIGGDASIPTVETVSNTQQLQYEDRNYQCGDILVQDDTYGKFVVQKITYGEIDVYYYGLDERTAFNGCALGNDFYKALPIRKTNRIVVPAFPMSAWWMNHARIGDLPQLPNNPCDDARTCDIVYQRDEMIGDFVQYKTIIINVEEQVIGVQW